MNAATTTSTTPAPAVKPLPSIPDYGENAIEITNLTFSYRATDSSSSYTNTSTNNPENVVLQDMNLSLPTGSRCLLIGANGSGKSVRFTVRIVYCCGFGMNGTLVLFSSQWAVTSFFPHHWCQLEHSYLISLLSFFQTTHDVWYRCM